MAAVSSSNNVHVMIIDVNTMAEPGVRGEICVFFKYNKHLKEPKCKEEKTIKNAAQ